MKQVKTNTIGALVGMGPSSTSPFYDALIETSRKLAGARRDDDFPEILMLSLPTPFEPSLPMNDAVFERILAQGLQRLEAAGSRFIAVPCNVVHRYMETMQRSVAIDVLDITELVLARASKQGYRRLTLIATRATIDSDVYARHAERVGIEFVPLADVQSTVDALLAELKAQGKTERLDRLWQKILNAAASTSCDALVIACTDLSVLKGLVTMPVLDSTDILATECVERWMANRAPTHV